MIQALEVLHSVGFIHNDIKPNNIMVDCNHDALTATLIDFGLTTGYLDSNKEHIDESTVQIFRGNMTFASVN